MHDKSSQSPFVVGRPLRANEFIGRKSELRTVFNRIRKCESSAIVGEPHIGKTSFLLQLADPKTRKVYGGNETKNFHFVYLDLQPIGQDFNTEAFWEEILYDLSIEPGDQGVSKRLDRVRDRKYTRRALEDLFSYLGSKGRTLVVLLDEFEVLLHHPEFQDASFFALSRSLSTRTGGVLFVTASRYPVSKMNSMGRNLLTTGSPFFNHMLEITLYPLNDDELLSFRELVENRFNEEEWQFILRVAGTHPYLMQAMASSLWALEKQQPLELAAETFFQQVSFHYDDLWANLEDKSRTTAIILCIMEFGGRCLGEEYSYGEIERVEKFIPELRTLFKLGLAKKIDDNLLDWKHLLLWNGERWSVNGEAFTWWVRDVVLAETRSFPEYNDWVEAKQYHALLTQEQWKSLKSLGDKLPSWALDGVGTIAKKIFMDFHK